MEVGAGGEAARLRAGSSAVIPAGVEHQVRSAGAGTVRCLDVLAAPRVGHRFRAPAMPVGVAAFVPPASRSARRANASARVEPAAPAPGVMPRARADGRRARPVALPAHAVPKDRSPASPRPGTMKPRSFRRSSTAAA